MIYLSGDYALCKIGEMWILEVSGCSIEDCHNPRSALERADKWLRSATVSGSVAIAGLLEYRIDEEDETYDIQFLIVGHGTLNIVGSVFDGTRKPFSGEVLV